MIFDVGGGCGRPPPRPTLASLSLASNLSRSPNDQAAHYFAAVPRPPAIQWRTHRCSRNYHPPSSLPICLDYQPFGQPCPVLPPPIVLPPRSAQSYFHARRTPHFDSNLGSAGGLRQFEAWAGVAECLKIGMRKRATDGSCTDLGLPGSVVLRSPNAIVADIATSRATFPPTYDLFDCQRRVHSNRQPHHRNMAGIFLGVPMLLGGFIGGTYLQSHLRAANVGIEARIAVELGCILAGPIIFRLDEMIRGRPARGGMGFGKGVGAFFVSGTLTCIGLITMLNGAFIELGIPAKGTWLGGVAITMLRAWAAAIGIECISLPLLGILVGKALSPASPPPSRPMLQFRRIP